MSFHRKGRGVKPPPLIGARRRFPADAPSAWPGRPYLNSSTSYPGQLPPDQSDQNYWEPQSSKRRRQKGSRDDLDSMATTSYGKAESPCPRGLARIRGEL